MGTFQSILGYSEFQVYFWEVKQLMFLMIRECLFQGNNEI